MWRIKEFFRGIGNFWKFRKEIYKFRSWDYEHNMELFIKSLKITAENIKKNKSHVGWEEQVANIYKFIELYNNHTNVDLKLDEDWIKTEESNYNDAIDF